MKCKENFSLKGHVNLKVFDKYGKPLKKEWQTFDNLIVGKAYLLNVLIGGSTISYNGVGSGTISPAIGDEDCDIPIPLYSGASTYRKKITFKSVSGDYALFSTYYATGECNADWYETILATGESGANVISHALLDDVFEKTTQKRAQNDWIFEWTG